MGLSAGGNAKAQALKDGYTPEQATRYGVLIGASEGALQYLLGGIGKLGGKLTGGVAKKAIQNIDSSLLRIAATGAIKMAGEGTEEYLQEILDPIYRNLLFNENNQIDLTDPEAVYSFLLGALTAGVMDGSEIIREGIAARPSSLPNVNGAIVAADAAQNIQSKQTAMQNAAQETEQYVYTDETTGVPMVGERPVRRMNAAADEISTTLDGATKHRYAVQEGANGGADLRAQGKTIHLDAVEATAIAEAYEGGMDAVEYTMAFHTVYEQAKQGKELGQIRKKGIGRSFAKPDIKAAYSAGRLANQRASALDPNSEFKAGVTMLPDAQLSKEQETQLDVLDAICRKYGVTAIVDNALYLNGESNPRSDVNAAYNSNTNRIHINLNAIGDAYLAVGVHELTHYVRANNAAGYSTLEGFVLDALRSEGENVDALVRYQMDQFGYSEEIAREEVVANTIPAILNDESYVKRLIETDRTLAERIRDFLREFIDTIKETLRTLEGEASWKQMQSIRQDTEMLSTIADMFDAALGETQAKHSKYDSGENSNRFSAKDHIKGVAEYTEDEINVILRDKKNSIAETQGDIVKFVEEKVEKRGPYCRLFCGKVSDTFAERVLRDTGKDVHGSSLVIDSYFENSHADAQKEASRGQTAIRPETIAFLPAALETYESVEYVGTAKDGREALIFTVDINGRKIAVEYYSATRKSLTLYTMYGWEKKKNLSATSDANAPDITPEVTDGFGSDNSIRNSSEKINLSAQDVETNAAAEREKARATELTGKRKAYKRRHERAFIENVAKALGIPGTAKGELRKMISELGDRVIATGQLSEADAKAMFEKCYEAAREYDSSMVEQYGPLKEYLRNKVILSTSLTSEQRAQARGSARPCVPVLPAGREPDHGRQAVP